MLLVQCGTLLAPDDNKVLTTVTSPPSTTATIGASVHLSVVMFQQTPMVL
jgi:hypothetical protein